MKQQDRNKGLEEHKGWPKYLIGKYQQSGATYVQLMLSYGGISVTEGT